MNVHALSPQAFERMFTAVEMVRQRLLRAVTALEAAGVPYAILDGHAVAAWVSEVDESAVRNTQDVDILLNRSDLDRAKSTLSAVGFIYRHSSGIDMFLDGPQAKARDAVHVVFAGEKVRVESVYSAPEITDSEAKGVIRVVGLEALVRMKLTSNRRKDQVHLQDMIDIGLIDSSWIDRMPAELGARLQHLFDTPEG